MKCPNEVELSAFCEGELEARPFTLIEKHLNSCADCSQTVEKHCSLNTTLRQALADNLYADKAATEVMRRLRQTTDQNRTRSEPKGDPTAMPNNDNPEKDI